MKKPYQIEAQQAGAEHVASRTHGSQSECGAQSGRRDGGDVDCASGSRPDATAEDARQHQYVIESAFLGMASPKAGEPIKAFHFNMGPRQSWSDNPRSTHLHQKSSVTA